MTLDLHARKSIFGPAFAGAISAAATAMIARVPFMPFMAILLLSCPANPRSGSHVPDRLSFEWLDGERHSRFVTGL